MTAPEFNLSGFFIQFQDFLAPKLDTYEQAIYLYIFRHSRMIGNPEAVIGFKSARTRMACGTGVKGKPMSEKSAYDKLQSLATKGCLDIIATERAGKRIRIRLPDEIPGTIPPPIGETKVIDIESVDFFAAENRSYILNREGHRCFYCQRAINKETYVIEHVISRPAGNNTYRNLVAGCRECNNRKNDTGAEDFLRLLYRESVLSGSDFKNRLKPLELLRNGGLKPAFPGNTSLAPR